MLPKVIIHSLISADGKMEGFSPEGIGLYYSLASQLGGDTWLIGSDTLLDAESMPGTSIHPADRSGDPLPNIAPTGGPLMVVPDSRGRVRNWLTHSEGIGARGSVALISTATQRAYLDYLQARNVPHIQAGDDHVDLRVALAELHASYGSKVVRTDSGGVLTNVLLAHGLVMEISLLISPELVGKERRSLFRTLEIPDRLELAVLGYEQVGEGYIWLRYQVRK